MQQASLGLVSSSSLCVAVGAQHASFSPGHDGDVDMHGCRVMTHGCLLQVTRSTGHGRHWQQPRTISHQTTSAWLCS
jgi:hypothetical protein